MANGPVSYNHGKLNKPIDTYPDNMKLIGVYEDTTLAPKATAGCTGCVPPIAFFASKMLFSAVYIEQKIVAEDGEHALRKGWVAGNKGWASSADDHSIGELADPKTKFAIYVSGTGSKASMMKYKNKWWIVFGSDKKRNMRRITLHVPVVEFSTELLDKAESDFFDFIRGTVREAH